MPRVETGFRDDEDATGSQRLAHFGPTLMVDIGFDPEFEVGQSGLPVPQATNVPGLVDTGATESHIDIALAEELDLPLVDQRHTVAGVGGNIEIDLYLAQIVIPGLGFTVYGRFGAVNLSGGGQTHRALLGRTLLRNMLFIYDGMAGRFTLLT